MSESILISEDGPSSMSIGGLMMSPGLGFISGVIIDSQFAERRRIERLLGAVTQNPRMLGVGIDRDTAIIVECGDRFRVLGAGVVYIVDGMDIKNSNLSDETAPEQMLTVCNVKLHVVAAHDRVELTERRPVLITAKRTPVACMRSGTSINALN
jgi:cyanophycinase